MQNSPRTLLRNLLQKTFSFPVLLGAILVASALLATSTKLPDPDTLLHAAIGRQILATGTWPTRDTFSFTAYGNPSIAYEWLGEVMIAGAEHLGHLQGLMGLLFSLAAIFLVLLYYLAYLRSGSVKAAFVACLILWPMMVLLCTLRPQLLGYTFLVITLICLERFRQGRRKSIWILPGMVVLWVNIHASFLFGLFALAVFWASGLVEFRAGNLETRRWTRKERLQLEGIGLACALALPITPYGTRLAAFPATLLIHSPIGIAKINEYQPVSAYPAVLAPFLFLLLVFFLGQVLARPKCYLDEIIVFLFATYLAWIHLRFLFFFVPVVVPFLAASIAPQMPEYKASKDRYVLNAALMLLVAWGLFRLFPSEKALQTELNQEFPVKAVGYLQRHPVEGPMLNQDGWGDYLIWKLGPAHRVFIDTRSQLYEEAGVLGDFISMMDVDRDTPLLLRKYDLRSCLIATNAPLVTFLDAQPGWKRVYEDRLSTVFVRKKQAN